MTYLRNELARCKECPYREKMGEMWGDPKTEVWCMRYPEPKKKLHNDWCGEFPNCLIPVCISVGGTGQAKQPPEVTHEQKKPQEESSGQEETGEGSPSGA